MPWEKTIVLDAQLLEIGEPHDHSWPNWGSSPHQLMPRTGEGPCFILTEQKGGEEVDA